MSISYTKIKQYFINCNIAFILVSSVQIDKQRSATKIHQAQFTRKKSDLSTHSIVANSSDTGAAAGSSWADWEGLSHGALSVSEREGGRLSGANSLHIEKKTI